MTKDFTNQLHGRKHHIVTFQQEEPYRHLRSLLQSKPKYYYVECVVEKRWGDMFTHSVFSPDKEYVAQQD